MRMRTLGTTAAVMAAIAVVAPGARASVPALNVEAPVVYAACPGYPQALGCVSEGTIYVKDRGDRETELHERGHVWEREHLTDADRAYFARKLRLGGRAWFGEPGSVSPGEQFADLFAACAMGVKVRPGRGGDTGYGYVPKARTHRALCNSILLLDLAR